MINKETGVHARNQPGLIVLLPENGSSEVRVSEVRNMRFSQDVLRVLADKIQIDSDVAFVS